MAEPRSKAGLPEAADDSLPLCCATCGREVEEENGTSATCPECGLIDMIDTMNAKPRETGPCQAMTTFGREGRPYFCTLPTGHRGKHETQMMVAVATWPKRGSRGRKELRR